uniref:Uncharacterized protein n=1 Tax=Arundo donax TaxID=35708 RepID=A0A0A8YVL3_ARUDO
MSAQQRQPLSRQSKPGKPSVRYLS